MKWLLLYDATIKVQAIPRRWRLIDHAMIITVAIFHFQFWKIIFTDHSSGRQLTCSTFIRTCGDIRPK